MVIRFADVTLDLDGMQIERDGAVVAVEPQVFDVLSYLVRHRDRLVSRIELLDEVWGDRFVSDSALSSRIKSARRAIGDNGRDQRLIRTVHGRGFRFVGEVADGPDRPTAVPGSQDADAWAAPSATHPLAASAHAVADSVVATLTRGSGSAVEMVGSARTSRRDALDEVLEAASTAGFLVGRSGSNDDGRPYGPVLDALDEWLHRRPALRESIPAPCRAELDTVLDGGTSGGRPRLFLAVREIVAAAGRDGGAVLGIDDVHLIDRSTQDLVCHIARTSRRTAVVVAVTHREGFDLGPDLELVELDDGGAVEPDPLPTAVRSELQRVAVLGDECTDVELRAAVGEGVDIDRVTRVADAVGALSASGATWRWSSSRDRERLVEEMAPGALIEVHRRVAAALVLNGGSDAAIAGHFDAAGDPEAAATHHLAAATDAAWAQDYPEVMRHVAAVESVRDPATRSALYALRGDACAVQGDNQSIRWYREALRTAADADVAWLRVRLARSCIFAGDLDGAGEALEGVEPDGGLFDGGIMLITGMLAYYRDDLDGAEAMVAAARPLALAPGAPPQLLDTIALEGMIAHSRGEWFDRLRRELRINAGSADVTATVFDSHLCVAQFLLYGPTDHDEVIQLASELRRAADAAGSQRASGFAMTLLGEASLLSGDLDTARANFAEAVELHRRIGADTGLSHALQRLADVELAEGNRTEAERLCRHALPLARWSPLSRHLLQRTFGTLISAAPDAASAFDVVVEAEQVLDGTGSCKFCQVMVAVPAAIACAGVGELERARSYIEQADVCARRWDGPAWPAAVDEARSVLAAASGVTDEARRWLVEATRGYESAGQRLDVQRCRDAADDL